MLRFGAQPALGELTVTSSYGLVAPGAYSRKIAVLLTMTSPLLLAKFLKAGVESSEERRCARLPS